MVLDNIATRYHLLPSEVLAKADTLDYLVMDVAQAYQRYHQEREEAKSKGLPPPPPKHLTVNKMKEMVERVRKDREN